ncbi:C1 family peptidase [Ruficoccus sp. ZRK36]|uniref:C1 family peptidase n=1 Tax=Ruficoccus sp. ZRK36 TaxID=2866311 RepID=UPI001C73AA85|nr:C1 family peptidase [Ruficoccus sp. ZRK36]QYY36957.1 C1 family peptidase [Ruficoccus sp. ZRK36]
MIHTLFRSSWLVLLVSLIMMASPLEAARTIGKLEAGDDVFYNVRVQQVLPDAIIIRHSEGIAKVPMEMLPETLQRQFRYNPARAAAYREALAKKQAAQQQAKEKAEAEQKEEAARSQSEPAQPSQSIAPFLTQTPEIKKRVDLRPAFREMNLYAKNQGRRPSCAVFSVISALEYQQGRETGKPNRLSEEYLIWATRQSLGMPQVAIAEGDEMSGDEDLGFSLSQVVQGLRDYGVANAEDLPNTFGTSMAEIAAPPESTIEKARERSTVGTYWIRGEKNEERLNVIFNLLNNGVPVVIGLGWPNYAVVSRSPLIDSQTPREEGGHAITLVGYKCETGKPEDARFLFKNSWGPRWGNAGYGWISWSYLRENMDAALFLD